MRTSLGCPLRLSDDVTLRVVGGGTWEMEPINCIRTMCVLDIRMRIPLSGLNGA